VPLIAQVGRKRPGVIARFVLIYALLGAGAVTMVYPFLIMVNSTLCNRFDYYDFGLMPRYLWNRELQLKKYLFEKHAPEDFAMLVANYRAEWNSIQDLKREDLLLERRYPLAAEWDSRREVHARRLADWHAFVKTQDAAELSLYFFSDLAERYPRFLRERYEAEVRRRPGGPPSGRSALAAEARRLAETRYGESLPAFEQISLVPENFFGLPNWAPTAHPKYRDWVDFKRTLPPRYFNVVRGNWLWQREVMRLYGSLAAANEVWGTDFKCLGRLPIPLQRPARPAMARDWEQFVNYRVPRRLIGFDAARFQTAWRRYLAEKYVTAERFNRKHAAGFAALEDIPLSGVLPADERVRPVWSDFQARVVPADEKSIRCVEREYPAFLLHRYGSLAELNRAYDAAHTDAADIEPPYALADFADFQEHRQALLLDFLSANYRRVFGFLIVKGRALWNTFILVGLAVLSSLTVNPLAAYALSRFRLRKAHYILIFMLATMAFPAEVTMIPSFLVLRDLGLLNTFASLILPTLANGYSVFLLKGFFDSLPRELYEAATIDGASELTVFRRIVMPLSKPILAVIALNAFVAAYGGFMWAFLVCQDERMWTIMVFLFQFQWQHANEPWLAMTALFIAAVPTLLVFTFCQRIIMRGIVIPAMK